MVKSILFPLSKDPFKPIRSYFQFRNPNMKLFPKIENVNGFAQYLGHLVEVQFTWKVHLILKAADEKPNFQS